MSKKEDKKIDYDYDMYHNKIRKYIVTGYEKIHGRKFPIWQEDVTFKPERGIKNLGKVKTV